MQFHYTVDMQGMSEVSIAEAEWIAYGVWRSQSNSSGSCLKSTLGEPLALGIMCRILFVGKTFLSK